ncbi:MAG: bis-aminopropyl spermidine synthase family protein, partial [Candidatus Helarchaeota archaeon]|nr:bis-aminopropyl spermidine synthase family protein [Candidatus Helarchaeota archaeon]
MKNLTLDQLIEAIATSDVNPHYCQDVLGIILHSENLTVQKLIQTSRLPRSLVVRILQQLQMFLEPPSEYIRMKPETPEIFLHYIARLQQNELQRYNWILLTDESKQLGAFLSEIITKRAHPKRSLDQFDATVDTVLRRVKFLEWEGALAGTKILFLGDYDLTSVAVAKKGGPSEIHVVDIDGDLLSLIQNTADVNHFSIQTHHQDLRLDFPPQLLASFDVVVTDPPFTLNGVKLFLLHALRALAPNGRIYCCFGYSVNNLTVGVQFQGVLNEVGLVARTILENFNVYTKAQSIGSTSHLYKLQPAKYPIKIPPLQIGSPIYSGYSEKEDLVQLIGPSVRFRLIQEDLIGRIAFEMLKENPKTIAAINSPFGLLQEFLITKGVSMKCIELEKMPEDLFYLTNIDRIEMVYPPPSRFAGTYENLLVESPRFNLNPLIEWIKFKFCKKVYLMLPLQIETILQDSSAVESSLLTRTYLSLFWNWDLIISIPPEAFEPHFVQTAYLYEGAFLQKELLVPYPNRYILRELLEQP